MSEGDSGVMKSRVPRTRSVGPEPAVTDDSAHGGAVLVVKDLTCQIRSPRGTVRPVDGVSLRLRRGETLGIVGESGSGKSMLARSIMGIAPGHAEVSGTVLLDGTDLARLSKKDRRRRLGAGIGLVFQDPTRSLNPVVPIGRQITEGMRFHRKIGRKEARERAADLLSQVGISDPLKRLKSYPHELSGGMRQRVTIAAALACNPSVLIADEPTTALDMTVQKQILDLLGELQRTHQMAVILISHDLGVVGQRSDELLVMYLGHVVEAGRTKSIFKSYQHRYTEALLDGALKVGVEPHSTLSTIPGSLPALTETPAGCRFAPRCKHAADDCGRPVPEIPAGDTGDHWHRCVNPVAGTPVQPLATSEVRNSW